MSATEGYFVTRTVRTLELLAVAPRSASEVAELLAIHPRTARRMLARLLDEGYVVRPAGHRIPYSLSPRFSVLAARALLQQGVALQHHASECLVVAVSIPPALDPGKSFARGGGRGGLRISPKGQAEITTTASEDHMSDLRVLTIKQVAELVQLSPETVMRAIRAETSMPPSSRKAEAVGGSKNPR